VGEMVQPALCLLCSEVPGGDGALRGALQPEDLVGGPDVAESMSNRDDRRHRNPALAASRASCRPMRALRTTLSVT
jgi:hypothetical protein